MTDQAKREPSRDRLDEVAEAFLERHRRGEQPAVTEYIQAHPELATEIRELFPALLLMEDVGGGSEPQAQGSAGAELPKQLGEYRILREVGRGGMGVVYEAEQLPLGRHVALKVLPFHNLMDGRVLDRFRREAQAAARLHHSNIAPVFGVGEHEGVHYFAMQFLHGQSLSKVIEELRRLREDEARPKTVSLPGLSDPSTHSHPEHEYFRSVARIGVQVGDALSYAHGEGVLHRDIKPSNLLLDGRGTVWVTDFGLAKADEADALTRSGDIVGTIPYMAPERFEGWSDPRSDVYGLGLTLYELCTLQQAFEETDINRLIHQVTQVDPPRPRKLAPHIPLDLETIVLKAIAKDPSHRYQTTAQLADDLRRYLAGEPIRARRSGIFERTVKWAKRRPATAALVAVSAAAVLTLLVGALYHAASLGQALRAKEKEERQARRAQARAESERDQKDAALRRAHGLRLSAQAHVLADTNPGLALLLGIEGARRHPGGLANQALFEALRRCLERKTLFHRDWVNHAIFSPDGNRVVSASMGGTAHVWDSATGALVATLDDRTVLHFHFSPDGSKLLTTSLSGVSRLWDAETGKQLLAYSGQGGAATHIWPLSPFSADGKRIVTGSEDGTLHVWDASTGKGVLQLSRDEGRVRHACFSADGRRIFAVTLRKSIRVWDGETGELLSTLRGNWYLFDVSPDGTRIVPAGNDVRHVWDAQTGEPVAELMDEPGLRAPQFSPGGSVLFGASLDGTGHLWDTHDWTELATLVGHTGVVTDAAFSADGRLLVTACDDRSARLWDVSTGRQLQVLRGHDGRVRGARFSPDARSVVTASFDGTVRLWDSAPRSPVLVLRGHEDRLSEASFSPDGERVVTASDDTTARLWDVRTGKELLVLRGHSSRVTRARFRPDGRRIVTGSHDATARLWDAATGTLLATLRGHAGPIWDVAFSPNGKTIATASRDGSARLWDSANGRLRVELKGHSKKLEQTLFSPDGRFVATLAHDGTVRIWAVGSGTCVAVLPLAIEGWGHIGFSPGGLTLAAGAENGVVDLWDVATWKRRTTLVGHNGWTQAVRFSPDSRRILTCNEDGTARLWDAATGSSLEKFSHPAAVYCGAFSPDCRWLATGGGAGELTQLWEVETGELLLTMPEHSSWVKSVEFSPDGRRLLTASHDGTARIWRLDLLSLAPARAPRELTREERIRYLDLEQAAPGTGLQAGRLVNRLFADLVLKADVLQRIETDRSLDDSMRTAALQLAQGREETDSSLNTAAWAIVSRPGWTEDVYRRGLRLAERAHQLAPRKLYILNTLGVAQYRVGAYADALESLQRADSENETQLGYPRSQDLGFIVMALHRLGRTEDARAALETLRKQMTNPNDAADPNGRAAAAEAERLLGKTREPKQRD